MCIRDRFCTSEMMLNLEDNDWWDAVTTPYDPTMDWATDDDKECFQYALDTVPVSYTHLRTATTNA